MQPNLGDGGGRNSNQQSTAAKPTIGSSSSTRSRFTKLRHTKTGSNRCMPNGPYLPTLLHDPLCAATFMACFGKAGWGSQPHAIQSHASSHENPPPSNSPHRQPARRSMKVLIPIPLMQLAASFLFEGVHIGPPNLGLGQGKSNSSSWPLPTSSSTSGPHNLGDIEST